MYDEKEVLPHHFQFLTTISINGKSTENSIANPSLLTLPEENIDLNAIENEILKKALEKFSNNQTLTSQYLNISRGTLRTRMKNNGLLN